MNAGLMGKVLMGRASGDELWHTGVLPEIILASTSDLLVSGNQMTGASGLAGTFIAGTSVTRSVFTGNILRGYNTTGLSLDSGSSYNTVCWNDINPAHITTPISDSETNAVSCGSGSSGLSGMTAGYLPKAATSSTITANSALDDGVTTAATITSSEPIATNTGGLGTVTTGHLIGNTSTPSVAYGAAVGTPTSTSITGTDMIASIAYTSGTAGSAGTIATVTFANAYASAPQCVVSQNGGATHLGIGWSTTTTTLVITNAVAVASTTAYKLSFMCGQ